MKLSSIQIELAFEWLNNPRGTANLVLLGHDAVIAGPFSSVWFDTIPVIQTVTLTRKCEHDGKNWDRMVRLVAQSADGTITLVGKWQPALSFLEAMVQKSELAEATV